MTKEELQHDTVDSSEIRDQLTSWGEGSFSHYFTRFTTIQPVVVFLGISGCHQQDWSLPKHPKHHASSSSKGCSLSRTILGRFLHFRGGWPCNSEITKSCTNDSAFYHLNGCQISGSSNGIKAPPPAPKQNSSQYIHHCKKLLRWATSHDANVDHLKLKFIPVGKVQLDGLKVPSCTFLWDVERTPLPFLDPSIFCNLQ